MNSLTVCSWRILHRKCLADMNIVRRWISVAVSTLPGIPAQRARHLSEYLLVFATGGLLCHASMVARFEANVLEARFRPTSKLPSNRPLWVLVKVASRSEHEVATIPFLVVALPG